MFFSIAPTLQVAITFCRFFYCLHRKRSLFITFSRLQPGLKGLEIYILWPSLNYRNYNVRDIHNRESSLREFLGRQDLTPFGKFPNKQSRSFQKLWISTFIQTGKFEVQRHCRGFLMSLPCQHDVIAVVFTSHFRGFHTMDKKYLSRFSTALSVTNCHKNG